MADKTVAFGDGTLTARATESTVDIANNRSLVLVSLILSTSGTWYGFHDGSASVRVNGSIIGTASGSTTDQPSSGGTKTIISNAAVWVPHDANGQASVTFSGHLTWPQFPMNVDTGNGSLTLSDIIRPPFAPTGVVASRVTDSQMTVTWTNDNTAHHGYYGMDIYRSVDGGGYAGIGVVVPGTTSFTDNTVSANHKYQYKIHAFNDAGSADSAASSAVYTTPGAPTSCTATKQPNNNVVITWSNHAGYSEYTTRVEESVDGGAFSEIDSVAGGVTSYTAVAPDPAHTHRYRVRARSTTGALDSGYSTSGTVTLLSTANPPTGLSPSGVARDATGAIVLTWTHNPADGTPQSKRRVQYKIDAGSFVDAVNDSSSTSSYTLPAGTLTNGHTITWRVATAGQNGTLSSFSAESTFTTRAAPTVIISSPGATADTSHLTAAWTYFQAQGSAQATFLAQLLDSNGNLLEQITGTSATSATFTTPLADGTAYTVAVTVTSAAGLSSATASQAFTVTYLPPAAIAIAASYDPDSGRTVITLVGDNPVGGVTEPIATVDIQRQIDGGDWVTFATGIVLDPVELTAAVLDTRPTIVGTNTYRAIAKSDLPSSVTSDTVDVVTAEKSWSFLSYGDGFGIYCRMRATPSFAAAVSRNRALYHFAGRPKPVQLSGEAVDLVLSISGQLREASTASTPEEFEAAALTAGVVLWRDPTGRRVFGSISSLQTQRGNHLSAQVSFTVTEVDYSEGAS